MNVLQHTRNELNLCLKQNRPDRSYRDTLLIFGCSFLRVAWIAYQLIFRESGRREVGFLLSDCKRGWSLEIKQSCQEIVRNEVEYKVSHK